MGFVAHNSKRILFGLMLILLGSIGAVTAGAISAAPGDALYPIGRQFDKMWASRAFSPAGRTKTHLYLAGQQMADLETAVPNAPQSVEMILTEWERAVKEAIFNLAETAPADQEVLLESLVETMRQSIETMARLQKSGNSSQSARLLAERITTANNIYRYAAARPPDILALLTLVRPLTLVEPPAETEVSASVPATAVPVSDKTGPVAPAVQRLEKLLNTDLPVSFPPDTTFEHPFPLDGRHGQLTCQDCHAQGIYKGVPDRCTDCHTSAHQTLFTAEVCLQCHQTANWLPHLPPDHPFLLEGKHLTVSCRGCHPADQYEGMPTTCQGCHAAIEPHQGLFGSECQVCHTTRDWPLADFDHVSLPATNCQNCHDGDRPPDHYSGQCSACHLSVDTWDQILFDHTGHTDCRGCHSADSPAAHYPGQCDVCHLSATGWQQINFNHAGQSNCQSCHSKDSPPDHYSGQCNDCHLSVDTWNQILFDHTGRTGCRGCHSADSPANHYPGQCDVCHTSTAGWQQINFNHAGQSDCQSCHSNHSPPDHYSGQCSACHLSVDTWNQILFDHTGRTGCRGCHSADSPANHYPGQCSTCHISPQSWSQISFDHSGISDCEVCHVTPQYPRHYKGECVQCHTSTNEWKTYTFNHTGQKDCQFCHARPLNHFPGQCDLCHTPGESF